MGWTNPHFFVPRGFSLIQQRSVARWVDRRTRWQSYWFGYPDGDFSKESPLIVLVGYNKLRA